MLSPIYLAKNYAQNKIITNLDTKKIDVQESLNSLKAATGGNSTFDTFLTNGLNQANNISNNAYLQNYLTSLISSYIGATQGSNLASIAKNQVLSALALWAPSELQSVNFSTINPPSSLNQLSFASFVNNTAAKLIPASSKTDYSTFGKDYYTTQANMSNIQESMLSAQSAAYNNANKVYPIMNDAQQALLANQNALISIAPSYAKSYAYANALALGDSAQASMLKSLVPTSNAPWENANKIADNKTATLSKAITDSGLKITLPYYEGNIPDVVPDNNDNQQSTPDLGPDIGIPPTASQHAAQNEVNALTSKLASQEKAAYEKDQLADIAQKSSDLLNSSNLSLLSSTQKQTYNAQVNTQVKEAQYKNDKAWSLKQAGDAHEEIYAKAGAVLSLLPSAWSDMLANKVANMNNLYSVIKSTIIDYNNLQANSAMPVFIDKNEVSKVSSIIINSLEGKDQYAGSNSQVNSYESPQKSITLGEIQEDFGSYDQNGSIGSLGSAPSNYLVKSSLNQVQVEQVSDLDEATTNTQEALNSALANKQSLQALSSVNTNAGIASIQGDAKTKAIKAAVSANDANKAVDTTKAALSVAVSKLNDARWDAGVIAYNKAKTSLLNFMKNGHDGDIKISYKYAPVAIKDKETGHFPSDAQSLPTGPNVQKYVYFIVENNADKYIYSLPLEHSKAINLNGQSEQDTLTSPLKMSLEDIQGTRVLIDKATQLPVFSSVSGNTSDLQKYANTLTANYNTIYTLNDKGMPVSVSNPGLAGSSYDVNNNYSPVPSNNENIVPPNAGKDSNYWYNFSFNNNGSTKYVQTSSLTSMKADLGQADVYYQFNSNNNLSLVQDTHGNSFNVASHPAADTTNLVASNLSPINDFGLPIITVQKLDDAGKVTSHYTLKYINTGKYFVNLSVDKNGQINPASATNPQTHLNEKLSFTGFSGLDPSSHYMLSMIDHSVIKLGLNNTLPTKQAGSVVAKSANNTTTYTTASSGNTGTGYTEENKAQFAFDLNTMHTNDINHYKIDDSYSTSSNDTDHNVALHGYNQAHTDDFF